MTDIKWTDLIQSVGVIAALLFTAWEMHRRTHEQRFQSYVVGMSGFVDLARLMVERPELHDLYQDSDQDLAKTYEEMSYQEKAKVHYCDTIIALCETVWRAAREGHVAQDEWPFWEQWARDLGGSPYFRWTVEWVKGEYDAAFLAALVEPHAKQAGGGDQQ